MKQEMEESKEYIPGACNIGPSEIKRRKSVTLFSLILTVATLALILVLQAEKPWRLLLFIPMASLIVNAQQVYFKFCVNFGIRGIFNLGDLGKQDTVAQAEFRKKDRTKAIQMITTGILVGIASALLFYFLPL